MVRGMKKSSHERDFQNTTVLKLFDADRYPYDIQSGNSKNKLHAMQAVYLNALRLFDSQGFDDTTIEEIATKSGVVEEVIDSYFPSKESIVAVPLGYLGRSLSSYVRTADASLTPLEALGEGIIRLFEELSRSSNLYEALNLGYRVVNRTPSLRELNLARRSQLYIVAWKALLQRGVDPDDQVLRAAASGIVACSLATMFSWLEANMSFNLVELTKSAISILTEEFR